MSSTLGFNQTYVLLNGKKYGWDKTKRSVTNHKLITYLLSFF
ncbi:hypothetical protein HMPREF9104_02825 [Lentilactobacillus kisonensis F0435]|uniref:Uncharacterized protein n=1 Tax=Lentilactobacillus kisonensis F0435 TaxID=797516 RepID=H1LJN4_9LACO|nr:hypothetical protein HMPREF9104_02825 [Lentilactobacillus kisonensis F0435]